MKPVVPKNKASKEAEDFASKTDKLINANSDDLTMADQDINMSFEPVKKPKAKLPKKKLNMKISH